MLRRSPAVGRCPVFSPEKFGVGAEVSRRTVKTNLVDVIPEMDYDSRFANPGTCFRTVSNYTTAKPDRRVHRQNKPQPNSRKQGVPQGIFSNILSAWLGNGGAKAKCAGALGDVDADVEPRPLLSLLQGKKQGSGKNDDEFRTDVWRHEANRRQLLSLVQGKTQGSGKNDDDSARTYGDTKRTESNYFPCCREKSREAEKFRR